MSPNDLVIFVGLIDAIEKVVNKLKKDFPEKSVGAFHSKVSKEDKESVIKKDNARDLPGMEGDFTNSSAPHLHCP